MSWRNRLEVEEFEERHGKSFEHSHLCRTEKSRKFPLVICFKSFRVEPSDVKLKDEADVQVSPLLEMMSPEHVRRSPAASRLKECCVTGNVCTQVLEYDSDGLKVLVFPSLLHTGV